MEIIVIIVAIFINISLDNINTSINELRKTIERKKHE